VSKLLDLIQLSGSEAADFLQGQVTCDVHAITNTVESCLGAHCNPSGRVLATFRLFHAFSHYYLLLPKSMGAYLLEDLKKYVLFYSINLKAVTADWAINGFIGPAAETIWENYYPQKTLKANTVYAQDKTIILTLPGPTTRIILLSQAAQTPPFNTTATASETDWYLEDIRAGIASIYPETRTLFTPHQLHYHLIQGISFNKGCYTGQEIVARMHYLGQLKNQLYQIALDSQQTPKPGEPIVNATGKTQGTLVMASPIPKAGQAAIDPQRWSALACLNKTAIDEDLYWHQQPVVLL
jgi:tRNA-modifying protein YgfZ